MELTCANDAIAALKTPGKNWSVAAEKQIARNTSLIYYADELVGLKLHNTVIAHYTSDGVTIDVRGDDHKPNEGWFTMTTWRRINEWTNAKTMTKDGLRHVVIDPHAGTPTTTLYAHGIKIGRSGTVIESPLTPDAERQVRQCISELPLQLGRYASAAINAWENWNDTPKCCKDHDHEADAEHLWTHIKNDDLIVPNILAQIRNGENNRPSIMPWLVRNKLAEYLAAHVAPLAVREIARSFPFPQLSQRQITRKVTEHAHKDC